MDLMDSQDYQETMQYLYQTYPEHGGREDLYHLVAMYMFHLEEGGIYSDADDDDENGDDENGDDENGDDKENSPKNNPKRKHPGDIMSFTFKIIRL